MNELSDKVLQKIKDQNIRPLPRFLFRLLQGFWLLLFFLSVVIGALAVAFAIFMISEQDWDVFAKHSMVLLHTLMVTLPYIWLGLLGILALLSSFYFKHTKRGYKKSFANVFAVSIVLSLSLGTLFWSSGKMAVLNDYLAAHCQACEKRLDSRPSAWNRPQMGFLMGEIKESTTAGLKILAPDGKTWTIELTGESYIQPMADLSVGQTIKIVGTQTATDSFEATEIKAKTCNCLKACGQSCNMDQCGNNPQGDNSQDPSGQCSLKEKSCSGRNTD